MHVQHVSIEHPDIATTNPDVCGRLRWSWQNCAGGTGGAQSFHELIHSPTLATTSLAFVNGGR